MKEDRFRKHILSGFLLWIALLIFITVPNVHASEDPILELTVTKGDVLINICKKYLENWKRCSSIARLNSLKNPDLIYPGERLLIPVRLLRGIPLTCEVTFLKGDVRVRNVSRGPWTPLHLGDKITQGMSVQTGHESATELTFEDGATFFIRPDTSVKVEVAQRKTPVHILQDFFIDMGRILIRIRRATGIDSRHKIRTPSAVASPRGTEFRVSVDSERSTRSEVLKGMIEVGAMNQYVELQEEEGTWVKRGEPPQSPRKLLSPPLPLDLKTIYKHIPFEIAFEQIKGSPLLRVMVAVDRDNKDIVQEKVIQAGETMNISGLQDGVYYLFTQSIDGVGLEGPLSEPFVLKLRVNPLPPFIQLPRNDAELRERSAEIRWLKVEDAASYHLQVAEDPEFTLIREEKEGIREESYKTGKLDYDTYYFRVKSVASDGYEGDWSSVGRFVVIPPPPSPTLEEPETGEKTVQLRWHPSGGIQKFHFQMAADREFREVLIDEKIDQASILIPKPKPGFYYVRTSSIDAKGYEGEFSKPQSFEIKPPPPPRLEKPEVDKKMIHLRWSSSGENISYHLQLAKEEAFKTILVDQKIPKTSTDLEKPNARGIYYVRVSGVDADGNEGEFSTVETVKIKKFPTTVFGVGVGVLATIGLILILTL